MIIDNGFQVSFLRMWFTNNEVDTFTVSVRFMRLGELDSHQGIVSNGNFLDTAGFSLSHVNGMVLADITTEDVGAQVEVGNVSHTDAHAPACIEVRTMLPNESDLKKNYVRIRHAICRAAANGCVCGKLNRSM